MFLKKWPLEYQKVNKIYLPTYLCDSSDIIDKSDSSDSSDSSDNSDSSDQKNFFHKINFLFTKKKFVQKITFFKLFF